jgi:hypothetical protein
MIPNGGYEPTVSHNEIGVSRADLRLAAEVHINASFKIQKNLHAVVGCTDGLDSDYVAAAGRRRTHIPRPRTVVVLVCTSNNKDGGFEEENSLKV